MKIAILGAGAWGTALACMGARVGCDVTLWSYNGLFHHLPDVVPDNIYLTASLVDLADASLWMMAIPAEFFRATAAAAAPHFRDVPILICTKGMEDKTYRFMAEILASEIPQCTDVGVVSGPQFAAEVITGVPTGSVLAGTPRACDLGQMALKEMFLVPSHDIIGTEICGVGKNAVALICGYTSVASRGENERAMILTRAWGEVVDFGLAHGADMGTFLGLAGMGDLFLSATSRTSRNFTAGRAIASASPVMGTVEGMVALRGLVSRASELSVKMPVIAGLGREMGIIE